MLRTKLKNQMSCNNCYKVLSNEESASIHYLPVTKSLQTSLNILLESEELTEPEPFFVTFERVRKLDLWTTKSPKWVTIEVLQLKRFVNHNGDFIKDIVTKVHCTKTLSEPLVIDKMSFYKKVSLVATVSNTGILNGGHYTAFIN